MCCICEIVAAYTDTPDYHSIRARHCVVLSAQSFPFGCTIGFYDPVICGIKQNGSGLNNHVTTPPSGGSVTNVPSELHHHSRGEL